MDFHAFVEELLDERAAIRSRAGEAVELRHGDRVAGLDALHELVEFRPVHRRACELFADDFLASSLPELRLLIFEAVAFDLHAAADPRIPVFHEIRRLCFDDKFLLSS